MKKIITVALLGVLLSCNQKNPYQKMAEDMKEIVSKQEELITEIYPIYKGFADLYLKKEATKSKDEYIDEINSIDIQEIEKLKENFIKNYGNLELKPKTLFEEECIVAITEYPKWIDGFTKIFKEDKAQVIGGEFLPEAVGTSNLRFNLNSSKQFIKVCEFAGEGKKTEDIK